MRGAIAAGHPLTAEAGARVLAEGGTAIDACLAAAFVSWVTESPLTGPGAGGFLLLHRAHDGATRLLDFFVAVPGLGGGDEHPRHPAEMEEVGVAYTPESSQIFRIGAASCAVPGAVAGLAEAHRLAATRPWTSLLEPAIVLARSGFTVTSEQAYLHEILDPILRHTEVGRAAYGGGGALRAGDRLVLPELASTLERLAAGGPDELYGGGLGRELVQHLREVGGKLTLRDLAEYRVVRRRPVRATFLGHELASNPPPSSSGVLIGFGLSLLDRLGTGGPPGSAEATVTLVEVMRELARVRTARFTRELQRGGLAGRLFAGPALEAAVARVRARLPGAAEPPAARGTTHISVVDGDGNAASLTASTGSGSGIVVPGTGVHLNNMLGEFDLAVSAGDPRPGRRMTSMMAPSLVFAAGRPRLVLGSAGSLRLRNAIFQIIVNVVAHRLPVSEAVDRPRVHVEEPNVHVEGGTDPVVIECLEQLGYPVACWTGRNLYFGGTAAVEVLADGTLAAAGDPRRGGAGVVVG